MLSNDGGREPFPDAGGTSEPLVPSSKSTWQRFGDTGQYRDVPFAAAFVLQLLGVCAIAVANGYSALHGASTPSGDPDHHGERGTRMLAVLATATVVSGVAASSWILLLRSGARALIWCGAGGGVVLALANGIWLLAQGGAAGYFLGVLSLLSGAGCFLFIYLNRLRIEFSAHLLSTVAWLTRAYPGTLYVAVGAAAVLLGWTLIWVAAVSYTAQMRSQASVLVLLLCSYIWVSQVLRAVVNATVAGTVASWYFLSPNVPPNPTVRSLRRALTTSFGSLCLGALVAASLKTCRTCAKAVSSRSSLSSAVRGMALCCLGFLDVLTRFFNELAYTQVAMYGKTFTRASRDTWTLLVHHSGVDALVQRELVSTALTLSAILSGLVCSLICGVWARATLGEQQPHWWQTVVASYLIGYCAVSLVSVTVESGVSALFVCYAEDPSPLASISPDLYAHFIQRPHVSRPLPSALSEASSPRDLPSISPRPVAEPPLPSHHMATHHTAAHHMPITHASAMASAWPGPAARVQDEEDGAYKMHGAQAC